MLISYRRNPLVLSGSTYFAFFLAFAALMPYLTIYYDSIGLSGKQIGGLLALQPFINVIATPLWGALADITQKPNRLLTVALVATGLVGYSLSFSDSFLTVLPIIFLYTWCTPPIIPLMDSGTLAVLGDQHEKYGRVRLWGSLGWVLGGLIFGRILDSYGFSALFIAFLLGMILSAGLSLQLPAGKTVSYHYWATLRQLVADRRWRMLLTMIFIYGYCSVWAHQFLGLQIREIGGTNTDVGIAFAIGTMSEVGFFYFGERIRRIGTPQALMLFALACYALRLILIGSITTMPLLFLIQCLHGINFGLFMLVAIPFANRIAPDTLKATAQSLLWVFASFGSMIGAFVGGNLKDSVGLATAFQIGGSLLVLPLVGLFILYLRGTRK